MGSVAAVTNCGNMMWRLWIIALVLSCECLVSSQQYYEPVWSGQNCGEDESVDVGRGTGSCNSDCDCPLCAPYCSTSGYCQNHQRAGRRKCSPASASTGTASASTGPVSACPPLLGDPAPPGCNKTFADDEGIPCWDDTDCPSRGTCVDNVCNLWVYGGGGTGSYGGDNYYGIALPSVYSAAFTVSYTSPISGQSKLKSSCSYCSKTTCPSSRPCMRGGKCRGPRCNRRGR